MNHNIKCLLKRCMGIGVMVCVLAGIVLSPGLVKASTPGALTDIGIQSVVTDFAFRLPIVNRLAMRATGFNQNGSK